MSFASMKRNRKDFTELVSKLEESKGNKSAQQDERFWKPERDKAGNGFAIIRFLPEAEGEDLPWVQSFSHSFQGPGGWFIDNCRTTLGQKCPVCESNTELWNSGIEANKNIARDRKRKLTYISNIVVISDPNNKDNEGKQFLYKYGKSIFNIINEAMDPQFEDETPVNPFDLWEGANFKIKIRLKDGYVNYDKSEFGESEALNDDDKELEVIWKNQYALDEFIADDQFKEYDEQAKRLARVLGMKNTGTAAEETLGVADKMKEKLETTSKQKSEKKSEEKKEVETVGVDDDDDDDDETLSYFANLANSD